MIRGYIFEAYNARNMRKLVGTLLLLYLLDLNASRLIRMKVEGDEHGGFHMPLYVGTPPIEVTNITLDTGSTLTIFPCTTCLKCNGGEENLYDPEASFTNSKTKCSSRQSICENKCKGNQQFCQYTQSYLEGTTILGRLYKDNISLTNQSESMLRGFFGCIQVEDSVHEKQRVGSIMGLGPSPIENILYPYFEEHPEAEFIFSTCYSQTEGFFQIGPNPEDNQLQPLLTFRYEGSKFYLLSSLDQVTLGSVDILKQVNNKAIVDTGTSRISLPDNVLLMVMQQLIDRCTKTRICASFIQQSVLIFVFQQGSSSTTRTRNIPNKDAGLDLDSLLPSFDISAGGHKYSFKASEYLLKFRLESGQDAYILAFREGGQHLILGIRWLKHKKIVTNLKHQTITVLGDYNCTYTPIAQTSMPALLLDAIIFFKSVKIQYYIISGLSLILLIILLKVYFQRIRACCSNFTAAIVAKIKKQRKKTVKKVIELNEEVTSKEDVGNQSTESVENQSKGPSVPAKYKRRGRGGTIRKR